MGRVIATDDDARRHSWVWFGPASVPLPVGARLPAVAWAFVLIPAFTVVVWVMTPFVDLVPGPGPLVFLGHAALAVLGGAALAVLLIRKVGKNVSPVTPLRFHVDAWKGEIYTPRPTTETEPVTIRTPDLWAPLPGTTRSLSTTIRFDSEDQS